MSALKKTLDQDPDFSSLVKSVSQIVSEMAGIQLNEKQFSMVENRLKSRMIRLSIQQPEDYLSFLKQNFDSESKELLSLLTTHHTYFFREFTHFEFLIKNGLNDLVQKARQRGERKLRVWSAAASRGQEVYSLAMFLDFHLKQVAPDFDFEIWGTDVDPQSISVARNGVYPYKDLKQVPAQYLGQHWARGTGEIADYVKAKKTLSSKVHFTTLNLVQPHAFQGSAKFDLIFCRNVFIYFNPQQIKKVAGYLFKNLTPGGYLITGISEPLNGLGLSLNSIGPSIYIEKSNDLPTVQEARPATTPTIERAAVSAQLIRVLCVDDSPSIIVLLKRILAKDFGFEVVATAANGLQAIEILKTTKVDLVTLDIHMPEMDGISYLKANMSVNHPPVVMISSVNRENTDSAIQALKLGAVDYVEKPTMSNLSECGEEIRTKAKMAIITKKKPSGVDLSESFQKKFTLKDPQQRALVFFAGLNDLKSLNHIIMSLNSLSPTVAIAIDAPAEMLETILNDLKSKNSGIHFSIGSQAPSQGSVRLHSFASGQLEISQLINQKKSALIVLGLPSQKMEAFILGQKSSFLFMEDLGIQNKEKVSSLYDVASAYAPLTSCLSILEENWS